MEQKLNFNDSCKNIKDIKSPVDLETTVTRHTATQQK